MEREPEASGEPRRPHAGVIRAGGGQLVPPPAFFRRPGFGLVLLLILAQLVFRLSAPDEDWANFISVVLQAAVLGVAMIAAHLPRKPTALVGGLVAAITAVSVAALLNPTTEVGTLLLVTAALVVLTPAMILYGAVRSLRAQRTITLNVMLGVLGIYLLLGYAFSLVFHAIGDVGAGHFFANGATESSSNYLYFSFATMTTVGYGDLTAAEGIGRAFATALALIGQIYLVTVVAMIVSNVGSKGAAKTSESGR